MGEYIQGLEGDYETLTSSIRDNIRPYNLGALSRIAMTCRTWAKICRPEIFRVTLVTHGKNIRNFQDILRVTGDYTGRLVKTLKVRWPRSERLTEGGETPSLSLFLAMSGQWLRWLEEFSWGYPSSASFKSLHAPPRVETALAALLHPIRTLTTLVLHNTKFKSFPQLLRILRAVPLIEDINLDRVTVLHAPERLHWPRSIVLTALGSLTVWNCNMPLHTLPSLVSIGLRGTPNPDALLIEGQQYSMIRYGGYLHPRHEDSILQVARSLTNFHTTLPDRPSQEEFTCFTDRHQLNDKNNGEVCTLPSHFYRSTSRN